MNSTAIFNATLQVIAALLTFVAVFLALVLCTITCLVAAELIFEHASVVRDYGVRPVSSNTHVLSEIDGEKRKSSRQHFVCRLSDGSKDATRFLIWILVSCQPGTVRNRGCHG
jgi:hypothetical protein